MLDTPVEGRQRALLEQLAALNDRQAQALDTGDMTSFTRLSDLRGQAVSEALAYLPPHTPWAPALATLAAQVRERSEDLQQSIHTCMAVVRRDMAALTQRQQATQYLSGALPHDAGDPRPSWRG